MTTIKQRVACGCPECPYLNTKQAAFRLGMSWASLKRLRLRGEGPTCRLHGGTWRYHIADLDGWSQARAWGGGHD